MGVPLQPLHPGCGALGPPCIEAKIPAIQVVEMDCPGSAEENVALTPAKAVTPDGGLRISDFPAALTPLLSELDDSGDGVLDIEELTEMCTVYISMKRAAADGSIAISSLPKELHGALEAFDVVRACCQRRGAPACRY